MTFGQCVSHCAGNPEFVAEFNRLTGRNLGQSLKRSRLAILIDESCGYSGEDESDMAAFAAFVFDVIWDRLPEDAFKQDIEEATGKP